MPPLRPAAKTGLVILGFLLAFAAAWIVVAVRIHFTQGPEAQASSGMYAAGDSILGIGVFGLLSLIPLAFALYWLRPVERFWTILGWIAATAAFSGFVALGARMLATDWKNPWLILADARIALMPLTSLAFATCAIFAPQPRFRWKLLIAAVSDVVVISGIVLVQFVLPALRH